MRLLLSDDPDERLLQLLSHQLGLATANQIVDQISEAMNSLCRERDRQLRQLKLEFDHQLGELTRDFDHRVALLEAELQATRRAYAQLQALSEWPGECASSVQ
jgi:small-conductance mechanosensitive channel